MARRHLSPIVAVDVAILAAREGALSVLLMQRTEAPAAGYWALPGALLDPDADAALDDTARRMLREKMGIEGVRLEQIGAFSGKDRDPRDWSISVAYAAPMPPRQVEAIDASPISTQRRWFPVRKLPAKIAFDHADILMEALRQLVMKLETGVYPTAFVPEQFTLGELQATCEAILDRPLDKSAFRRVLKSALERDAPPLREVAGEFRTGTHRPAQLYSVA